MDNSMRATIDRSFVAWQDLLEVIVKLLARNSVTVPFSRDGLPSVAVAAIERSVVVLYMDRPEVEAVHATAAAAIKWLTVGELLRGAYDDPKVWRPLGVELAIRELEEMAAYASDLLDQRDAQN
ncbi:hypothetical protein GCM10017673_38510 [Streptosporangium violaceochromogenes]|nr:hypothetical protein GCM10017673_38510 [Streptosporangium violaceochromogenes]